MGLIVHIFGIEQQEYLGIYPYITKGENSIGKVKLYVNESEDSWKSFDRWLDTKLASRQVAI